MAANSGKSEYRPKEELQAQQGGLLQPYLSPLSAWALSVGTAIGWGSLVVTSRTYLPLAGPAGSILGLLAGLVLMLTVAWHYHYLGSRYPGTGGLYHYVQCIFGHDLAFLTAWFMFLTYIAIFWANATSIPLFAKYFLRGIFRFGYLYTIFGYEVYLGEALLTMAVMALIGLLCMRRRTSTARIMTGLVLLFSIGISICFAAAMAGRAAGASGAAYSMEPAFVPDKSTVRQVLRIIFISPWAFIGFESVSHTSEECRFPKSRVFRIYALSLIVTTALYIFAILLSVSAYPEECTGWQDYISRLDEFEGIKGLPAFYAADHYLGSAGVLILMASLLALVLSSLIGTLRTLGRLCYAAALDGILSERFSKLSDKQIPANAILLVLAVSLPTPFMGRTTIGWIVDTTTIGAMILYGFASAAVLRTAVKEKDRKNILLGGFTLAILAAFLVFLLFPQYFADYTIETETYVLMTVWSILGLLIFNRVIGKDRARNFGKAIVVWITLLIFIVVVSMTWMQRVKADRESTVIEEISRYYNKEAEEEILSMDEADFLRLQQEKLRTADSRENIAVTVLFALSLAVLSANYFSMKKWERKAVEERDLAHTVALRDALTGVKSKYAFSIREEEMEAKIRAGEAEAFGIVVGDVNGLKVINDTKGHKAGDEYIRACCRLVCLHFDHSPVFRIGGDEFAVLLQGHDYEERTSILRNINAQIEKNIGTGEAVISLGLSEYDPENDRSFQEVFRRADAGMYERKRQLKDMGAAVRE